MGIVASVLIENDPQVDGRAWLAEQHTDQLGLIYIYRYLGNPSTAATIMANRVAVINALLQQAEIGANIAGVETLGILYTATLNYSTAQDNATALIAAYATMTQTQAIFVGEYLNQFAPSALAPLFGQTVPYMTNLQTTVFAPAAVTAAQIRAAQGHS